MRLSIRSNLRRAYLYGRKNGWKNTFYASAERLFQKGRESYHVTELSNEERVQQKKDRPACPVTFTILVPAYRTREAYLREMIESVTAQTYPFWELVIADAGGDKDTRRIVLEYAVKDSRIRHYPLKENGGISKNTNEGLIHATGDYIGLLDHDDVLTEDALYEMASAISHTKGEKPLLLYSDEDKMNQEGNSFYEPHWKPDFNYDLLLSNNYICHFLVMEAGLLKQLKLRAEYDGAQDYDLILRAVSLISQNRICHISRILYHWRCHTGSTADNPSSKMYAYEAGKRALEDHNRIAGKSVCVTHTKHLGFYRVTYQGDIFSMRQDIAAVGGKILRGNKIIGGAYRVDGTILYEGLNRHFSGYLHRAILTQDVDAVDLRCMTVRKEWQEPFQKAKKRAELAGTKEAFKKESIQLCQAMREQGYRILWDPAIEIRMTKS